MRATTILAVLCATATMLAPAPAAQAADSLSDRVEELQQEIDSLTEDIEDLSEPMGEFDLFDQCMYTIGVTQYGRRDGSLGYFFGRGGRRRLPALAMAMRGFSAPRYDFLAFPGEEPPSIECNEDAGEEEIDE